jgi:hypothetical protein
MYRNSFVAPNRLGHDPYYRPPFAKEDYGITCAICGEYGKSGKGMRKIGGKEKEAWCDKCYFRHIYKPPSREPYTVSHRDRSD